MKRTRGYSACCSMQWAVLPMSSIAADVDKQVRIPIGSRTLGGFLAIPHDARSIVVFAHGRGSSRFSPENSFVAEVLRVHGFGVLLMDLLAATEGASQKKLMDTTLLADRLLSTRRWLKEQERVRDLNIGLIGSNAGAAAALKVAALLGHEIGALVCRSGRLDLVHEDVPKVLSPTLLVVGGNDRAMVDLNNRVFEQLRCTKRLEIVQGAGPLFEQSGALEQVAYLANAWFTKHLSEQKT